MFGKILTAIPLPLNWILPDEDAEIILNCKIKMACKKYFGEINLFTKIT